MTRHAPYGPRPSRRGRQAEGFTLIEVMMAVAVMTVGALGILALQQAATRGNMESRQMTVATEVTRLWIERARRDALVWNTEGTAGLAAAGGPVYLSQIPDPGAGPSAWFVPMRDPPSASESYAFDYLGRDTLTTAQISYCSHMRLSWVNPGDTMRVEVRTYWHRRGPGSDGTFSDRRILADCSDPAGATAELAAMPSRIRAVYAATLVRWTPLR